MKYLLLLALLYLSGASTAIAAEPDRLGTYRDWDAFTLGSGTSKTCYMATVPKKKRPQNVGHGNVYVTVAHKPQRQIRDEVNIVVGYKFQNNSTVATTIGGTSTTMFTSGSEAWAYDPAGDIRIVAAMKRGSKMVARGTSARGTRTTYEFSLYGFTAAYNAMSKACNI